MLDNNAAVSRASDEGQRLDLYSVIKDVAQQWISIALPTLSAVLLSFVLFSYMRKPGYVASTTVAVKNVNEDTSINSYTSEDVSADIRNAIDAAIKLVRIIDSAELRGAVARKLEQSSFQGSVTSTVLNGSNLMEIKVSSSSASVAYREAEAILSYLSETSGDMLGGIEMNVVQPPVIHAAQVNAGQNRMYAILFGALAFIAICVLLAWWSSTRNTVRNKKDVIRKLGSEPIGAITRDKKHGASLLIKDPAVSAAYSEEIRSLAVRLLYEMQKENRKTLLVSGAMKGEGKSTVAVNLALAMAQMHKNVILVDMDFQDPSLARLLNMQDGSYEDLAQYLEERSGGNKDSAPDLTKLLVSVPGTELTAVLNRKAVTQAVDKYAPEIAEMMELLKGKADLVIADTTSTVLASDAEELSAMADASIVVVREHFAEVKYINNTIEMLGGRGRVLGCVFNNMRNGGHYEG